MSPVSWSQISTVLCTEVIQATAMSLHVVKCCSDSVPQFQNVPILSVVCLQVINVLDDFRKLILNWCLLWIQKKNKARFESKTSKSFKSMYYFYNCMFCFLCQFSAGPSAKTFPAASPIFMSGVALEIVYLSSAFSSLTHETDWKTLYPHSATWYWTCSQTDPIHYRSAVTFASIEIRRFLDPSAIPAGQGEGKIEGTHQKSTVPGAHWAST